MKLIKDGNIWKVDFTARGKRHRLSTGTRDKRVAEVFMRQLQTAAEAPNFARAEKILRVIFGEERGAGVGGKILSFGEAAGLPLEVAWGEYEKVALSTGRGVSEAVARRKRQTLDRLIKWLEAKRPTVRTVEGVTGVIAAAFAADLGQQGLKTKTRANTIGELGSIWQMLGRVSEGLTNIWHKLAPRDIDGERGKAFSPEDEAKVLEAAKVVGKDWLGICMVMRGTGLRYGDVARLTRQEVKDGVIRLTPNKTKRHGISVAIPLTREVADVLERQADTGDYYFPLHAERYEYKRFGGGGFLQFREVLAAAGLEGAGYTIHSWRHTAATRLAAIGADIETRKRILGHTEDVTARRYDHDEHLEETRKALEKAGRTKDLSKGKIKKIPNQSLL